MSKYGGAGSRDLGHEEYFAKMSGAVTYSPKYTGKIDSISRSSIPVINAALIRNSDFLITIGAGSFHSFVLNQFAKERFQDDPENWSTFKMYENARSRGMTRDGIDYSKYLKEK